MKLTIEYLEYIVLIFIRVASIVYIAPFFSLRDIPRKVKVTLAFFLTIALLSVVDYKSVTYSGAVGYATLAFQEGITGILIGMASGFCMYVLNFSGAMIDMEIGFSMAMEMDPTTNIQSTISANFLNYLFVLMFIVSDMQYYIIDTLFDSYKLIPIGGAVFKGSIYTVFLNYIVDYFVIGFRIILPIFACVLVINVILGILAKIAPQMNMFVVGMQIKVMVGLFLLFMVMQLLPGMSDFLFQEMHKMTKLIITAIKP